MAGSRWLAILILAAIAGTAYLALRRDGPGSARSHAKPVGESVGPTPEPVSEPASEPQPDPIDVEAFVRGLSSSNRALRSTTLKKIIGLGARARPLRKHIVPLLEADTVGTQSQATRCQAMIVLMQIDGSREFLPRLASMVPRTKLAAYFIEQFDPVYGRAITSGARARAELDSWSETARTLDELLALAYTADAGLGARAVEALRGADTKALNSYLLVAARVDPIPAALQSELLSIIERGDADRARESIRHLGGPAGKLSDPQRFADAIAERFESGDKLMRHMAVIAIGHLGVCDDVWAQRLATAAVGRDALSHYARLAIWQLKSAAAPIGPLLMEAARNEPVPRLDMLPSLLIAAPDAAPDLLVQWIEIGSIRQKIEILTQLRAVQVDRKTVDRLVRVHEQGRAGPLRHVLSATVQLDPTLASPSARALVERSLRDPILAPQSDAVNALGNCKALDRELARVSGFVSERIVRSRRGPACGAVFGVIRTATACIH